MHLRARASRGTAAARKSTSVVGGDAKGQDFTELIRQVEPTLRGVDDLVEDRVSLRALQAGATVPRVGVDGHGAGCSRSSMRPVALLPGDRRVAACASWDQFGGQRGIAFTRCCVAPGTAQWGVSGGDE